MGLEQLANKLSSMYSTSNDAIKNTSLFAKASIFCGLGCLADGISTYHGMNNYGISIELNPTVRSLADHLGIAQGISLYGLTICSVAVGMSYGLNKITRSTDNKKPFDFIPLALGVATSYAAFFNSIGIYFDLIAK